MKGILCLLQVIVALGKAGLEIREYQRKINEREIKIQHAVQTFDIKIAQEHNKNLLLEQKIEKQELEIIALRRSVGIAEPFTPTEWDN